MKSFSLGVVTNVPEAEGSSILSVRCHNGQDQNPKHVERKTLKLF
jgi:hypothetical protein